MKHLIQAVVFLGVLALGFLIDSTIINGLMQLTDLTGGDAQIVYYMMWAIAILITITPITWVAAMIAFAITIIYEKK